MIIEFLYKKIKVVIFMMLLPPFLINIILFCTVAILNEDLRNYYKIDHEEKVVKGNDDSDIYTDTLTSLIALNLIAASTQFGINLYMFRMMGMSYLNRGWSYVDLSLFIINVVITTIFYQMFNSKNDEGHFEMELSLYMGETMFLRIILMLG